MEKTGNRMRFVTPALSIIKEKIFPSDYLQIEPTTLCNLSCKTCTHKDGVPAINISEETLISIFSKHPRISGIKLQGLGEPMMHPQFQQICKLAASRATVTTITNGTIIKWDALKYLSSICVSVDTLSREKAQQIKGKNYNLDLVLKNLLDLKEILPTSVNYVASIHNIGYDPVREFCESYNMPFHYTPVQNWYAFGEPGYEQAHKEIMEWQQKIGVTRTRIESSCPWNNGRYFYYRADGVRNPCCIRMGYKEYMRSQCCKTCPL